MTRSAIVRFALILATALISGAAAAQTTAAKEPVRGVACTMEYAPVCGTVGKQRRTFGNLCMARASGAIAIVKGACRTAGP